MYYFQTLPLITKTDYSGNQITVNNLLTRAYLLPSLQKNVMLFYTYNLMEGDTPENIAYRYYNDPYRYWLVLYSNGILDPQAEWPLTNQQFLIYLNDKYSDSANGVANVLPYTTSTIHHYEQTVTTSDTSNLQEQVITIEIDEQTYTTLIPTTKQISFPNGIVVTKSVDKNAISIYDYENKLNESKRNVQLMRDVYVLSAENQMKSLMS